MTNSIIIWAWIAWQQLYELVKNRENILWFFDDNKQGDKILWKTSEIIDFCNNNKVNTIYYAIPSQENKELLEKLLFECKNKWIKIKIIPSLLDIIDWDVKVNYIKDVNIEDLLFRPIRKANIERNKKFLKDKIVLITWAAWTIGSELIKQCLHYGAKQVIWIDHSELWIFNQMKKYWQLTWWWNKYKKKLFFHIKSIRDKFWLDFIFKKYKPDIVFNAAAYKHVYQMELNPDEAIKTNIFWLKNVIEVSIKNKVKYFCQISTDKAVNPTNIMWASKRIWELLIQYYSAIQDNTKLTAVRFWNVLWSSWSVLTIWKEQIQKQEDITVTHKDIIRYFMSIEEAVNLVITSTTLEENWKIFILDMWNPIKIYDLAKKFIELSNAKWVWIKIIWLKPWEKLYEELILDKSKDKKTTIDKIYITEDKGNYKNILKKLEELKTIYNKEEIIKKFKEIIPEFNHLDNNLYKNESS